MSKKREKEYCVDFIAVSDLKPYTNNARKHSEKQIIALTKSIEEFGFTLPILVDNSCGIIAGHARFEAALLLGFQELPCIRLEHFTEAQRAAYLIADNKLAEMSEWDEELLRSELGRLSDEFGMDLTLIGFSEKELDAFSLGDDIEKSATEDNLPELQEEATTRPGDLWLLGEHRLICGDSTDAGVVERLLDGAKPHLMVTDPPYGVNYDPKWRRRIGKNKSVRMGDSTRHTKACRVHEAADIQQFDARRRYL
jgi:hypothetical protein